MPYSPNMGGLPEGVKPKNRILKLLADLMLPSDPADAAGDLAGPMMAAERVGAKAIKGVAPEAVEAFKRWFGKSKVVDEAGEPLRVFHGTQRTQDSWKNGAGDVFKPTKTGALGPGNYVAISSKNASDYANIIRRGKDDAVPSMMPLYASVKNPLKISDVNASSEELFKRFDPSGKLSDDEVLQKVKDAGYDAVWAVKQGEINVLNSNQLKSATGNSGAFDMTDPNIIKSLVPFLLYNLGQKPQDKK